MPAPRSSTELEAFALISHESNGDGGELATLLHRGAHVIGAQEQLRDMLRELISEGSTRGDIRSDVAADELASYCLHALTAAGTLASVAAVRRLVDVTLAGMRPPIQLE